MQTFHIPPFSAAIILSILLMGALGVFVILPIAFINWSWNLVIVHFSRLPEINGWQSSLLYIALACSLFAFGFVRIEVKTGTVE
jgi:hypothetical protein